MEQLPDMAPLQNLVEFVVLRPNHLCCNGFLGACNLSHVSCQKAFERFAPLICQPSSFDTADDLSFPTKETIEMCEGKPYRQCFLPGNRPGLFGPKCDPIEEKWLGCRG
ncbi:uncharacterized protein PITG_09076 [Phytophthora infestans T30-4]|uniref:Uncharacterized protein n=1 Tax=Phytophthora infestans (strain T30-4) TaxID=403677 RepID=D0NBM8_PHYIT|nr:uncharacterized protein PITG_09076 [Phytophthora infestans T30-4]EEY55183.1 hypothetical protein PITG_09076 [Phytophthora infestans T30-4]|eukprot:XP_002903407.1 hypothetical protein PITG_09076 [Phytophthora infestans T30-4]